MRIMILNLILKILLYCKYLAMPSETCFYYNCKYNNWKLEVLKLAQL
jgi:hypothetical protein